MVLIAPPYEWSGLLAGLTCSNQLQLERVGELERALHGSLDGIQREGTRARVV
jgi:hypothetical protein